MGQVDLFTTPSEIALNLFQDKYEEIEQIGEGSSCFVMKCKSKEAPQKTCPSLYAVKYIRNRDVEKQMESQKEYDILS